MARSDEIQKQLIEGIEAEEIRLKNYATECKERLDSTIAEFEAAKKELPELEKELLTKDRLLNKLTKEIEELKDKIAIMGNIIRLESGSSYFSGIKRAEVSFQQADYAAKSYVETKIKRLANPKV